MGEQRSGGPTDEGPRGLTTQRVIQPRWSSACSSGITWMGIAPTGKLVRDLDITDEPPLC